MVSTPRENESQPYEPDRLGRIGFGRRRPERPRDPLGRIPSDDRFDRLRERWSLAESHKKFFGNGAFKLKGQIGEDGDNDRDDVAKLESALAHIGRYDAVSTGGPTGYFNPSLRDAVKRFQSENGLAVDGIVNPGGATIRRLEARLTRKPHRTPASAREVAAGRGARFRISGQQEHSGRQEAPFTTLMPAPVPTAEKQDEFTRMTGLELRKQNGGVALTDRVNGNVVALMSEDMAARYLQNWESFSQSTKVSALLARTDLTDPEKIALADRLLPDIDERAFHGEAIRRKEARLIQKRRNRERQLRNEKARLAFRKAVRDMASGMALEDVLPPLQKALFPELHRGGAMREFYLDLAPGTGNARSIGHAMNDLAEIDAALDEGDVSALAWHSAMLLLDAAGIVPGGNVVKAVGRGALNMTAYGKAAIAEAKLRKARRQYKRHPGPDEVVGARKLLGEAYEDLDETLKNAVNPLINAVSGSAAERHMLALALNIDPHAARGRRLTLPPSYQGPGKVRTYDFTTRHLGSVVFDDALAVYARVLGKEPRLSFPTHYEVKAGAGKKSPMQEAKDTFIDTDREAARELKVIDRRDARLLFHQIPSEYVLEDATERLKTMVRKGTISRQLAAGVMAALRKELAAKATTVRFVDYADLIFRLVGSGVRTGEQLAPHFIGP